MNKKRYFILLLLASLFLSSCRGILRIDQTKMMGRKGNNVKRIVCLNPDYEVLISTKDQTQKSYQKSASKESTFNKMLDRNARKNGIQLQIIDNEDLNKHDASFFNDLAPLKQELLQVSYLQNFDNVRNNTSKFRLGKVIGKHEQGPLISPRFSYLADIYGTPFFSINGIATHKKPKKGKLLLLLTIPPVGIASFFFQDVDTYYYTIIADVRSAEIIYREVRQVNLRATEANLNSLLYDSFHIISK